MTYTHNALCSHCLRYERPTLPTVYAPNGLCSQHTTLQMVYACNSPCSQRSLKGFLRLIEKHSFSHNPTTYAHKGIFYQQPTLPTPNTPKGLRSLLPKLTTLCSNQFTHPVAYAPNGLFSQPSTLLMEYALNSPFFFRWTLFTF